MSTYQLLNCTIEAFKMDAAALKDPDSWPKWAIEARKRDQRLNNSIFPTDPENPENGYTIKNGYGILAISKGGWVTMDKNDSISTMEDIHFIDTYEKREDVEKAKGSIEHENKIDPKKPSPVGAQITTEKTP
jgi:hypothetical protein